eukprot:TRINITY_DN7311_c0_g2_i2.p1 TRINITY_DN7311_c0_g2~~TRINITY_DN7311_c0_g2_i2.p1  ORF type:complete len:397 (+),score=59.72 TRINITY_DN7311_c0_g2_i2:75-1265(+)
MIRFTFLCSEALLALSLDENMCGLPASDDASMLQARLDAEARHSLWHGREAFGHQNRLARGTITETNLARSLATQPWGDSIERIPDFHNLIIRDAHDYRSDAATYLQETLGRKRRCPLQKMSLREVEDRWTHALRQALHDTELDNEGEGDMVKKARWYFNTGLHHNNPVLVEDVMSQLQWPAAHRWSQPQMIERFRHRNFDEEFFRYHDGWIHREQDDDGNPAMETLGEYLSSNQSGQGIFIFVSEEGRRTGDWEAATLDSIRSDFLPHPNFAYPPADRQAMLNVDAIGSSHGFHFHNPVWQVQVEGYKMWYLMPPDWPADSPSHPFGAAPLGADGKPFLHPNACAMLKQVEPPPHAFSCMVAPGEMVLLPHGWWHATCGLSNYTASVGGWMAEQH